MSNLDIHQIISDYLYDLKDKINIYNLDRYHQNYIFIYDLLNINSKYIKKLTQSVIKQPKFQNIIKLNAKNNLNIFNVNHLSKLTELDCSRSEITQDGICNLKNLLKLNIMGNYDILNLNHLEKLTDLNCGGYCGITQNGIKNLKNILILNMIGNITITNISHMTKLELLYCKHSLINKNVTVYLPNIKIINESDDLIYF